MPKATITLSAEQIDFYHRVARDFYWQKGEEQQASEQRRQAAEAAGKWSDVSGS